MLLMMVLFHINAMLTFDMTTMSRSFGFFGTLVALHTFNGYDPDILKVSRLLKHLLK